MSKELMIGYLWIFLIHSFYRKSNCNLIPTLSIFTNLFCPIPFFVMLKKWDSFHQKGQNYLQSLPLATGWWPFESPSAQVSRAILLFFLSQKFYLHIFILKGVTFYCPHVDVQIWEWVWEDGLSCIPVRDQLERECLHTTSTRCYHESELTPVNTAEGTGEADVSMTC